LPSDPTVSSALPACQAAAATGAENHRSRLEQDVVELFDEFRDRLLRYLLSLGLTISDGEEVVQEVFLSLFQHLSRRAPHHNLRAWLFRVAHNLGLKRVYRDRRHAAAVGNVAMEDLVADPAPSPEDRVVERQGQARILAVVQALPELDRRCLALRAEGLRYRQIAEVLDMSLGAVSLSLSRSIARIARAAGR
jgi:RNA polymerase sigma-70 factor, ECF subfamily